MWPDPLRVNDQKQQAAGKCVEDISAYQFEQEVGSTLKPKLRVTIVIRNRIHPLCEKTMFF